MTKRWTHLDRDGKRIKHGARYIYDGPSVWNVPGGKVHGVIVWDRHLMRYMFLPDDTQIAKQTVPFDWMGNSISQAFGVRREPTP